MPSSSNNPVSPSSNQPPPTPPPSFPETPGPTSGSQHPAAQPTQQPSWQDPTGTWQKFLGPNASPHDVEVFFRQLMQFFTSVILEQSKNASKRASKAMKDSIEGNN